MYPRLHLSMIIASNAEGVTVSDNGDEMRFDLSPPVRLPKNTTVRMLRSTIWNVSPNVTPGMDGGPTISFAENPGSVLRSIAFPEGLYSLADISETLQEGLTNAGSNVRVHLAGDQATSKVSLLFDDPAGAVTSVVLDPGVDNGIFKTLLGFDTPLVCLVGGWFEGDRKAALNQVNAYCVRASFVGGPTGVFGSAGGSDVLDLVPIDVGPGQQIRYSPVHPREVGVVEGRLDGGTIMLRAEDGRTSVKNTEPWSVVLEFRSYERLD